MSRTSRGAMRMACTTGWLVALLAIGCSDVEVGSVWAPQSAARPALGGTFAWVSEAVPAEDDLEGVQQSLRDLLRQVVEQQYGAKGYQKAEAQQADFWIRCRIATAVRSDAYADQTFEQYKEGTLAIYIIDPSSGKWMWRGWGSARLDASKSPEEKHERLNQAVKMILKDLPDRTSRAGQ